MQTKDTAKTAMTIIMKSLIRSVNGHSIHTVVWLQNLQTVLQCLYKSRYLSFSNGKHHLTFGIWCFKTISQQKNLNDNSWL